MKAILTCTALATGPLVLGLPARAQAGYVFPRDAWKGFERGSSARFRVEQTVSPEVGLLFGPELADGITITLTRVSDTLSEFDCVETTGDRSIVRQGLPMKRNLAGIVPLYPGENWISDSERLVGEAPITIGDRRLECRVWELEVVQGGLTARSPYEFKQRLKVWECDDVPGGIVRYEGTVSGETNMLISTVVEYAGELKALHEKVKVGHREFECALLEGTSTDTGLCGSGRYTNTHRRWISDEFPGRVVRAVNEYEQFAPAGEPKPRIVITTTALEFNVVD